jgi:predicted ATPase/Tfp pilus assembly protein PilF
VASAVRHPRADFGIASTSFVGRDADLDAVADLLRKERLVTIVGAPGAGKTRVACELAAKIAAKPEGSLDGGEVRRSDLAHATSVEDICTAVGLALEVPLTGGRTSGDAIARLGSALAMRGRALLLLDNFEQVTRHATETLGTWLRTAPEARFLVTSRERLGVPGEVLYDLGPLPLPDGDPLASDAVRLFVERARAVRRGFDVGPRDAAVVAELVRHLDGLPLAIELAAARMSVLGPKQLLERLKLDVLDRSQGRAKHSTLRAALDGSWNLLEPYEQSTLAQISVFRGFSLEAAEEVIDPSAPLVGAPPSASKSAPPVLDVLQSLREKSLVRCDEVAELPGELRFGLLETVRTYAEDHLEQSEIGAAVQLRHATYYLREGGKWAAGVDGERGIEELCRLSIEAANISEVHRRALAARPVGVESVAQALKAVLALEPLFYTRGPARACVAMIDAALEHAVTSPPEQALCARSLDARGKAQRHLGRFDRAAKDLLEALSLAQGAGDRALEGRILGDIAFLRWREGHGDEARAVYEQALDLLRASGSRRVEGKVLGNLGIVLRELGRLDEAAAAYDRALRLHEEAHNRRSASIVLASRGELLRAEGRLDEARESFERALPIHREFGDRYAEGAVLADLGSLHQEQGRYADARACFEGSLACHIAFGNRAFEALAIGLLGDLERELGAVEEARTLYERARHVAREIGDRRAEGRWLASLAATDATSGRLESAAVAFDTAVELLRGDRFLAAAMDVLRGHLDLALARQAARTDSATAAKHRATATERIERAAPLSCQSAYVRYALRVLERALSPDATAPSWPPPARSSERPSTRALTVASTGRWFQLPGGEKVSLQRRHAMRLLLKRFVDHRLAAPGVALSLEALLEAGWPGQRVHPQAGASRVYNALTELRKLGLRDVLISRDDGYLLDGSVALDRIEEPG